MGKKNKAETDEIPSARKEDQYQEGRHRFGLTWKFSLGTILIVFVVGALAILVGSVTYWNSITKHYNTVAYQTAEATTGLFSEEELRSWIETVKEVRAGNKDESYLNAVTASFRYRMIWSAVDHLRRSMGANDIYIGDFDRETLVNFTQEAYVAKTWKPITYLLDSYYDTDKQYLLGQTGRIAPRYREETIKAIDTGIHSDQMIITRGEFGFILTAAYPVVYNGETKAFVGVEIPMLTLQSDIWSYIRRVLLVEGLAIVFALTLGVGSIIKTIIHPITQVSREAGNFIKDNGRISKILPTIHTGDEIQDLAQSLYLMEKSIGTYIENLTRVTAEKERISAELNVATQIQFDMLPRIFPAFPDRGDFMIYATMSPAKEVGGDFYDYFLIDDDHMGMVMADVSGKGVPAALFMVITKTLIKNQALLGHSPARILHDVNNQLCEGNEAELFVTVWLAILDLATGKGVAANAGHEHPVIRRRGGSFELSVYRHSPAVATIEDTNFREHTFELKPGDSFFVYTDGIPEATNAKDELFGTERMLRALNRDPEAHPVQLIENVRRAVDCFVKDAPQFDDLTMLAFLYRGAGFRDEHKNDEETMEGMD